MNYVEDPDVDDLGEAEAVNEKTLGDVKYTFIEDMKNSPLLHTTPQGFQRPDHRPDEGCSACWAPGRAEHACGRGRGARSWRFRGYSCNSRSTRRAWRAGTSVVIFSMAMLVIPKTLFGNFGLDVQDKLPTAAAEREKTSLPISVNLISCVGITSDSGGVPVAKRCIERATNRDASAIQSRRTHEECAEGDVRLVVPRFGTLRRHHAVGHSGFSGSAGQVGGVRGRSDPINENILHWRDGIC